MFYYDIEDGGVIIYYVNDNTITSIDIPESINGYPVAYISQFTFEYCFNLEYINGVKIKEGLNIINNRYLFIVNDEMVKRHKPCLIDYSIRYFFLLVMIIFMTLVLMVIVL